MTRKEIMRDIPAIDPSIDAEVADWMKDILDYFEGEFNSIRDLLSSVNIDCMEKIGEAHSIADKISGDIY